MEVSKVSSGNRFDHLKSVRRNNLDRLFRDKETVEVTSIKAKQTRIDLVRRHSFSMRGKSKHRIEKEEPKKEGSQGEYDPKQTDVSHMKDVEVKYETTEKHASRTREQTIIHQAQREEKDTSMDPNVWGSMFWDMLFTLAFHIRLQESASDFRRLANLLNKVLPCSHCRNSYASQKKKMESIDTISNEPDSASRWLWKMHDIVNAKLGKICISFEKLKKKHQTLTMITHDLHVVDAFALMTFAADEENLRHVLDAILIITRLLKTINEDTDFSFKTPSYMDHMDSLKEETLAQSIYELKQRIHDAYSLPLMINFEAFKEQYYKGLAV